MANGGPEVQFLLWGRCEEAATDAELRQSPCGPEVLNVLWEIRRIFHDDSAGKDFIQV